MRLATDIVIIVATNIDILIRMRTIQMTMDNDLIEQIDTRVKRLGTTRSAFARDAFRQALKRFDEMELEQRQIAGYRENPPKPREFGIPESDHAWGDDAWSGE